jgi:hypothetical protein
VKLNEWLERRESERLRRLTLTAGDRLIIAAVFLASAAAVGYSIVWTLAGAR